MNIPLREVWTRSALSAYLIERTQDESKAYRLARETGDRALIELASKAEIRAERRVSRQLGQLTKSCSYPFQVDLDVFQVDFSGDLISPVASIHEKLAEKLTPVAVGDYRLWFRPSGDAVMSFKNETDAVLFRIIVKSTPIAACV